MSKDRERELFEAALERPVDERVTFVRSVCEDDPDLAKRIERLLGAHEQAGLTATPLVSHDGFAASHPSRIGPYRIMQRLGEGGMGEVFIAEQRSPIQRRVALKLIKLGMDSREVIARFESERQALAMMNHPGIARILDAGATEEGRPYFVMEYVPGVSIVEYCDDKRLGITERLRLFAEICRAVQHAHQKGVIHRDLKPSNVLVAEEDGSPSIKVIDFGVAKATTRRLGERTLHTELGRMIGTPEYMSPEQAELTALDVDTRSDVYSLGVLLYELLVGARPLNLSQKSPVEIQRTILEQEPVAPSKRLGGDEAAAAEVARKRTASAVALRRRIEGELDWITLCAMSKDRRRRYQTALAFAEDIERFLNGETVLVSSPSKLYRLKKAVRRHALALGLAGAVGAVILGLVAFYTYRLAQERDRAAREAVRAGTQAATAEEVTEFLVKLFAVSDPGEARGNTITAREILDAGAARITTELEGQPEVQARLMGTMGSVYQNLGLYPQAEALLENAFELLRADEDAAPEQLAGALSSLGALKFHEGDYEEARQLHAEALALLRERPGPEQPDLAVALNDLALAMHYHGELEGAEPLYREALEIDGRLPEGNGGRRSTFLNNLGSLMADMGKGTAAEPLYRESLAIKREVLGDEHPSVANALNNLALLLQDLGDVEAAETLLREALALRRKVLGDTHPDLAITLNNLGVLLQNQGDLDGAEPLLLEALAMKRELLGEDNTGVGTSLNNVAVLLKKKGECPRAEPLFMESLEILRRQLTADNWVIAQVESQYGECYTTMGRYPEAEKLLVSGRDGLRAKLGDEHRRTLDAEKRLAELYETWGVPASNRP